jgi:hypothetical protein
MACQATGLARKACDMIAASLRMSSTAEAPGKVHGPGSAQKGRQ